MIKYGKAFHIIITALIGVLFAIIGEVILYFLADLIWTPLAIAIYFAVFGGIILFASYRLNKARGDYSGWSKKNLTAVVTAAFKKAAIALLILVVLAGVFEFVYDTEIITSSKASSYTFVIDDSGSMEGSDPDMIRVEAIHDIMKNEKKDFPFAIYRFTHEVEKIRDMDPYDDGEEFAFGPDGLTDIVGALRKVVDDIESGDLEVGKSPRVLLLSDGASDEAGLDEVIDDCIKNNITVSTISFGVGHSDMLEEIAEETGGIYTDVDDIKDLKDDMANAIAYSHDRNLLSERVVNSNETLYLVLRIVFLILLGIVFSWMKQKAYCSAYEHGFSDKVFLISSILCAVASILVEVLFLLEFVPALVIRLIFCILWAIIPGFFVKEGASGAGNGFADNYGYSNGMFDSNSAKRF